MLSLYFKVCYHSFMKDLSPKDQDQDNLDSSDADDVTDETTAKFTCPSCGVISRDAVLFLCNTCPSTDLVHKDGIYMCPSCLQPGDNFECTLCGSKAVKMELTS